MANIAINHPYTMPRAEVLEQVRKLADKMAERYQLDCRWVDEACMTFSRTGASGQIDVGEQSLSLNMQLGMMLGMFKQPIEDEVNSFLAKNIR